MNRLVKGIAVVLMAGGVITACTSVDTTEGTNTSTKQEQSDKGATVDRKAVYETIVVGDTITGAGGSTYEEVVKQLGEPTDKTESSYTGVDGKELKNLMATWYSFTDGSISITFTNGTVSHKMFME